jgi:hypothetical protein
MTVEPKLRREQLHMRDAGYKFVTEDAELSVGDYRVMVDTSAGANITVTLPPVSVAAGALIFIQADIDASEVVTVEDKNGDAGLADISLETDGDNILLYSTGLSWITVVDGVV